MAKETTTATPAAEKKKRGVAKGTKRPSKWNTFVLKYSKDAEGFAPVEAIKALASSLSLHVSEQVSKNRAGVETGKLTLVIGTAPIAKRAKAIMSKDMEKNALALFRATMRDPEKAPKLQALVEASQKGTDTSAEVAALIGL